MNSKDLKLIDKNEMHKSYDSWPDLAYEAYKTDFPIPDFRNVQNIIFSGMGGSGAVGDVLASILSKSDIHFTVVKGYLLPKTVNPDTLVITCSASGNTKETLSVLQSASKHTDKIVAFSNGGKMGDFCKVKNIFYQNIELIHSPRATFPRSLYSILKILGEILPIYSSDVIESINQIKILRNKINSSNLSSKNPSIELAEWIQKYPMIYYPWGLQSAAIRFKNSLQENSKIHAAVEDVIETCHNGIMGWETSSPFQPILLQGVDDYIKTKERWILIKEFFESKNIPYKEIHSIEGNILSKLIHLIYFLDYSTIYLAIKKKIDPTQIKSIDFIKNKIK